MKKVAIVILNWNGKNWLEQFLPKVIEHSKDAEIVVADNASTDDSVAFIQSEFSSVSIIQLKENHGFAEGYYQALKQVKADFYVILNSDVEVTQGWLDPLLETMSDPKVAGCQPKILSHAKRKAFEHAGASGGFIDKNYFPFCRGRILDRAEHDEGQYNGTSEIFWATGACLMIRAELFHEAGGFDKDFFAHMEEIDLCWRLKKQGHSFMAVPDSEVYHVGGGALPYDSPRKVYLNFRNNLMMIIKNHEGMLFPKVFWRMTLDGMAACMFLITFEFKKFAAVFRAHMWNYSNMGRNLKKRKAIKTKSSNFNTAGLYRGSLIWSYYFKGIRKFSELNQRLFL